MIKKLEEGESLILFPEGTRGEPEVMQKFKNGIGILLQNRPGTVYIPVFLKGMGKAMPKGDTLIVPVNSSVTFGNPFICKEKDLEKIIEEAEKNILSLSSNNI